jgi:hypothetical protein
MWCSLLFSDTYHPSQNLLYPDHINNFLRQNNKLSFWQGINYSCCSVAIKMAGPLLTLLWVPLIYQRLAGLSPPPPSQESQAQEAGAQEEHRRWQGHRADVRYICSA